MKRLIFILFFLFAASTFADDCVFDEAAFMNFIHKYSAEHKNTVISADGRTLIHHKGKEKILVNGGGCDHLGMVIELNSPYTYTEDQFLQKTLELSIEYGHWLINIQALKDSIVNGRYQVIDGSYYIDIDAMTVFNASYNSQGKINLSIYIN